MFGRTRAKALRTAKLIMVTEANNNKFYEMREHADGTFTAAYGRVGRAPTTRPYPGEAWDAKYREKLRKGYTDLTHLYAEGEDDAELRIDDAAVRSLYDALTSDARASIRTHYLVTADDVTPQQVNEAQVLLDALAARVRDGEDVETFNARLLRLYRIIPRKMASVQDHLVDGLATAPQREAAEHLLAEEQNTLDVMAGQVKMRQQTGADAARDRPPSLLKALGLETHPVEDEATVAQIRGMMGDKARHFQRAFAVTNVRTQQAFDAHRPRKKRPQTALLWHGSRNANWLSILESGLVRRPADAVITGKMFGFGLYFADRCRKSLNYTSLRGSYWAGGRTARAYLGLYDVHLGQPLNVRDYTLWYAGLNRHTLRLRSLMDGRRYDSVFAEAGPFLQNNEYVIYDEAQCTIRYLVEISC